MWTRSSLCKHEPQFLHAQELQALRTSWVKEYLTTAPWLVLVCKQPDRVRSLPVAQGDLAGLRATL